MILSTVLSADDHNDFDEVLSADDHNNFIYSVVSRRP